MRFRTLPARPLARDHGEGSAANAAAHRCSRGFWKANQHCNGGNGASVIRSLGPYRESSSFTPQAAETGHLARGFGAVTGHSGTPRPGGTPPGWTPPESVTAKKDLSRRPICHASLRISGGPNTGTADSAYGQIVLVPVGAHIRDDTAGSPPR